MRMRKRSGGKRAKLSGSSSNNNNDNHCHILFDSKYQYPYNTPSLGIRTILI
jgi:hypothetical protein